MKKANSAFSSPFKNHSEQHGPVKNQKGIALLMVLFSIVLLVTLVIEFNYQSRIETKSTLRYVNSEKALFLARSGLIAGEEILRSNLSGSYDGLDQFWAKPLPPYPVGEGTVTVKIEDETGKININLLRLPKSARSAGEAQVRKLFSLLELDERQVDEIVLWMACESDLYYQGLKPSYTCQRNHSLETLSELHLVRGMTDDIYAKISPFLTIYPQNPDSNNKININTADPVVLQTITYKDENGNYIFDISKGMAEDLVKARPLKVLTDFDNIPSFKSAGKFRQLAVNYIGYASEYFTISSLGEVNGIQRKMVETIYRPSQNSSSQISRNFIRLE
ncbi:MAG: type II secretion system minor pseudopilin GspK [Nitrospirae bacterium]|nr:type II secretion system minor pseudopilin GspK [Nitrospirota bacterium]